jgi:hypothetical protein
VAAVGRAIAEERTMSQESPIESMTLPALAPGEDDREWIDVRASSKAQRAAEARRGSGRRRGVDPTTSDRDYSREELEFMQAMQAYKVSSGRMFPTWSEVLEVLRGLGYDKEREPGPPGP